MRNDLYICDVDFDIYAFRIEEYWKKQDEVLEQLITILSQVTEHGISSGDTKDALILIKEEIKSILLSSKGEGEKVASYVSKYLKQIDDIDLNLYGG